MKIIILLLILLTPLDVSLAQGKHTSNKPMTQFDSTLVRKRQVLNEVLKVDMEFKKGSINSISNLMGQYQIFTLSALFLILGWVMNKPSHPKEKIKTYIIAGIFILLMYGLDTFQDDLARRSGETFNKDLTALIQSDTMSVATIDSAIIENRWVKRSIPEKLSYLFDFEQRRFQIFWYGTLFVGVLGFVGCNLCAVWRNHKERLNRLLKDEDEIKREVEQKR